MKWARNFSLVLQDTVSQKLPWQLTLIEILTSGRLTGKNFDEKLKAFPPPPIVSPPPLKKTKAMQNHHEEKKRKKELA